MRVYIAGPIAGKKNGNRQAFLERAGILRRLGYEPVNPWDIPGDHGDSPCCNGSPSVNDPDHAYGCMLREDLRIMMYCDAITLLSGWEKSVGASTEEHVARSLGMKVIDV